MPRFQEMDEAFLFRRIAQMADQQVAIALALPDEELLEKSKPDHTPQYAPATGSTPVYLSYH
ncbi:hypothetical protein [Streptomyces sp. NPDC058718]|uniref:hypothetical protein n=1 Tax=Streptomyces sp. NPDC058718 TaxID=3346610 RepID=UPI00368D0358